MPAAPYTTTPARTPVDQLAGGPGVSRIDPNDPAAPSYELLAIMRTPLSLREIMIQPVRSGYIGKDRQIDPKLLPPPGDQVYPRVQVETVYIDSPDGPVRCAVYRNEGATAGQPVILYIHGGGFMVGSSDDTDFLTRRLCHDNNAVVVSVNYRLAPEWPFPHGIDDVLRVYAWLADGGAEQLGGDGRKLVFAGDSSGGNFAAAAPLRARAQGLPAPVATILLGPVCDFRFEDYESFRRQAPTGIVYDAAFAGFMRGAYLRADQWDDPHVSPVRGDLSGYPPAIVVVGTHDPMIDSASVFAQRLQESGVVAELFVRDGMPHGFYFFPNMYQQEEDAYLAIQRFLSRLFAGSAAER